MKFSCTKDELLTSINIVQKAVSAKSTLPILEGILIETHKDVLKLVATDLDLYIETYMGASIQREGSIILKSRVFSEIVRMLPEGNVTIEVNQQNIAVIRSAGSEITLIGFDSDDFPLMPKVEEKNPIEISQDLISNAIRQVTFAVSKEETKPILQGVLVEVEGNEINFVALDGYRLALRTCSLDKTYKEKSVVIPGKTLNEISKVLTQDDAKVSITLADNHVLFDLGYTRIISRLLEGEFINYRQFIIDDYSTRFKVNCRDMLDSVSRASLVAMDGKYYMARLSIVDEKLIITSNSEMGKAYEELAINKEGNDLDISFNFRYLLEVLKVVDCEEIFVDCTTNVSPAIIRPVDSSSFLYLLLPVRTTNN